MTDPARLIPVIVGALIVAAAALVAVSLRRRLVVVTVDGPSMQPTYWPGDRVLVRRRPARALRAGDVVVIERPDDHGHWPRPRPRRPMWVVKRVVALPGHPAPVDWLPALARLDGARVPADKLVLLGDNAASSRDSRYVGYFPADRLLGVVVRSVTPPGPRTPVTQ
jgi:signal peptidase I